MNLQLDQREALKSQRHLFSIPEDVSYLNCAYMSPLSNAVIEAGERGLMAKSRPFEILARDFFEPVDQLKLAFAELIDTGNPDRVVIIPSASYGFATVAKNLKVDSGQNVVVLEEQFPSNAYVWQRLCQEQSLELRTITAPETEREKSWNQKILEAIDERTAMVSIGVLHWADGTLFDLQAIRNKTYQVGAKLVLDGTQAIGAMPFSVDALSPDALICSAYKWLMGPYSIGLAYFGPAFDKGVPLEENWINRLNSDDFRGQVGYQAEYRSYSVRYDMGEKSNFILIPMLQTAISQIKQWGVEKIQHYCLNICHDQLVSLQDRGFQMAPSEFRSSHLFGLRPPKHFNMEAADQALRESKVFVSFRGNAIRVSPHLYNTKEDILKLSDCLVKGL